MRPPSSALVEWLESRTLLAAPTLTVGAVNPDGAALVMCATDRAFQITDVVVNNLGDGGNNVRQVTIRTDTSTGQAADELVFSPDDSRATGGGVNWSVVSAGPGAIVFEHTGTLAVGEPITFTVLVANIPALAADATDTFEVSYARNDAMDGGPSDFVPAANGLTRHALEILDITPPATDAPAGTTLNPVMTVANRSTVPQTLTAAETALGGSVFTSEKGTETLPGSEIAPEAEALVTYTGAVIVNTLGVATVEGTAASGATATAPVFSKMITVLNGAPVLTPADPTLPTITEDDVDNPGVTVTDLLGTSVGDTNNPVADIGIAVVGADPGNGKWQYQANGETDWTDMPAVSESAAWLLRPADRVRFLPNGRAGTTATLSYRAWDQTEGAFGTPADINTLGTGGASPFSEETDTATITVTEVNDPPERITPASGTITLREDQDQDTSGPPMLGLDYRPGPAESSAEASQTLTFQFVSLPAATLGKIVLADGTTLVTTTDNYDLPQIRGLRFDQEPNANGSEAFQLRVTDSEGAAVVDTLTVEVAADNDKPTALPILVNFVAGQTTPAEISFGAANVADVEANDPAGLTFTITSLPGQNVLFKDAAATMPVQRNESFTGPTTLYYLRRSGSTQSDSFTYTVTDTGDPPGTPANALTSDPSTVTIDVRTEADLAVAVTVNPSTDVNVRAGDTLTYTVTVTNKGPSIAGGLILTNTLPANVTYQSSTGPGTLVSSQTQIEQGFLIFNASGSLDPSTTATFTIIAKVQAEAQRTLTNTASIVGNVADIMPANNTASVTSTAVAADLSVEVRDSSDPAPMGRMLTYTVTIRNAGPDAAENVTLTQTLPPSSLVEFVEVVGFPGAMPDGNGVLTLNLGDAIAANSSREVKVIVRPRIAPESFQITTSAAVVSPDDPIPANNTTDPLETTDVIFAAVVTSTADTGAEGTLRWAVNLVNTHKNTGGRPDAIVFDFVSLGDDPIFALTSGLPLPALTEPVIVAADRQVTLDADGMAYGLKLTGGGSIVRGLKVEDYADYGIWIAGPGGNLIAGNTLAAGAARPRGVGVYVEGSPSNIIGGETISDRNAISANKIAGVLIDGTGAIGNAIRGNRIGGAVSQGNGVGVLLKGGSGTLIGDLAATPGEGAGNVISGNTGPGIQIMAGVTSTTVQGNLIGTGDAGSSRLPNQLAGVLIDGASSATVGGTASGARNVISGNDGPGVWVKGSTTSAIVIAGNFIGLNRGGSEALPNGTTMTATQPGVLLEGVSGVTVGGTEPAARNVISGNTGYGVAISNGAMGNQVQGNWIGLTTSGSAIRGNESGGIRIENSAGNAIGGPAPGARNVISGNDGPGVEVASGAPNSIVQGNWIGTDSTGAIGLGNEGDGVHVASSSVSVLDNVIADNRGEGIEVASASGVQIRRNKIGTDQAGTVARGNTSHGIRLDNAPDAMVEWNTLADSGGHGLIATGSSSTNLKIEKNLIGTDANGVIGLGNTGAGVLIVGGASVQDGGVKIVGNVISGNVGQASEEDRGLLGTPNGQPLVFAGLEVAAVAGLEVTGNFIGISGKLVRNAQGVPIGLEGGTLDIGNTGIGARIAASPDALIQQNVISGNGGRAGLEIEASDGVRVLGNRIGSDWTGETPLENDGIGLLVVGSQGVTIGGSGDSDRNLIVNNRSHGIEARAGTSGLWIENNLIGVVLSGATALARGNQGSGVYLADTSEATIVGNAIAANRKKANSTDSDLLEFGNGIEITGTARAIVQRNFLGTYPAGTTAELLAGGLPVGNEGSGILVTSTADGGVTIGGSLSGQGNVLANNREDGVKIWGANGAKVQGNLIGTDATAAAALGNALAGVRVAYAENVEIAENVIAGNLGEGIVASDARNLSIRDNGIGTDLKGLAILGNQTRGVLIISSTGVHITGADGNIIANNGGHGIEALATRGLVIENNRIGTDRAGEAGRGNLAVGVRLQQAPDARVAGNVISSNGSHGIEVSGDRLENVWVAGNRIGTNNAATMTLGNGGDGVHIANAFATRTVGATVRTVGVTVIANVLSGNASNGVQVKNAADVLVRDNWIGTNAANHIHLGNRIAGVSLENVNYTKVQWNVISANRSHGVEVRRGEEPHGTIQGVEIQSNVIGPWPNAADIDLLGNGGDGVQIIGVGGNRSLARPVTVGGNMIAGNVGNGIHILQESSFNLVAGNVIGTDFGKALALGNSGYGVAINAVNSNATDNEIVGNTISANSNSGVIIVSSGAQRNRVVGNHIGKPTAQPGNELANRNDGVTLLNAGPKNSIGGAAVGDGNTIQGNNNIGILLIGTSGTTIDGNTIGENASHGVVISHGEQNVLTRNRIGVDSDGVTPLSNTLTGVYVINASENTIGGTVAGAGNIIAANKSHGVVIFQGWDASRARQSFQGDNKVLGNFIGTDGLSGTLPLGNKGEGVFLVESSGNTVGGTTDAERNVISANELNGIHILGRNAQRNAVLGNVIGTVVAGVPLLRNQQNGVQVFGAPENWIGSTPGGGTARGNIIATNARHGIAIIDAMDNHIQVGNSSSVSSHQFDDARAQWIQNNGVDGVNLLRATRTEIGVGNKIAQNQEDGIDLFASHVNKIQGSLIVANWVNGVRVQEGSSGNQIGVPGGLTNDIIWNHNPNVPISNAGVEIQTRSTINRVENNRIGIALGDQNRELAPGGQDVGVRLSFVSGNAVGLYSGNTISGNTASGIEIIGGASNLVRHNAIGTNLVASAAVPNQTGVFIHSFSSGNTVRENVISGNLDRGVHLFQSSGNRLIGNFIGGNLNGKPILIGPAQDARVYSEIVRQDVGVLVENSSGNLIGPDIPIPPSGSFVSAGSLGGIAAQGGNTIEANQEGVKIVGPGADDNQVWGNRIGPDSATAITDGRGNLFGVIIEGSALRNHIHHNLIQRNINVGVAILGSSTQGNWVYRNVISANEGYRLEEDPSEFRVTNRVPNALIHGTGIYVESARNNILGSNPAAQSESPTFGNLMENNAAIAIYLNANADNNHVRSNRVVSTGLGEYGILLYNSAGNLQEVVREGRFSSAARGFRIAQFREFTGPPSQSPLRVPQGPMQLQQRSVRS